MTQIGVSGPHATGKTTLIKELLELIPSAIPIDLDRYFCCSKNILLGQIQRLIAADEAVNSCINGHIYLLDRSPVDPLIYTIAEGIFKLLSPEEVEAIKLVYRKLFGHYTAKFVFVCPDFESIMTNIRNRKREAMAIMTQEDFVQILHDEFQRFFSVFSEYQDVIFYGKELNDPARLIEEMQRRQWIQGFDVVPEVRLSERFGLTNNG